MLETLDDLAEYMANTIGVYDAHQEDDGCEYVALHMRCRVCFVSDLKQRMRDALRNEQIIEAGERAIADTRSSPPPVTLTSCRSQQDGDCAHPACPQLRDNEPANSGRHCPLYTTADWEA